MARSTSTNFTGLLDFPVATAATDLFVKEDVQTLAQAVDQHDHTSGKGVVIVTTPAAGSITSAMIADGTIQGIDIAAATITGDKLAGASIATDRLVDGAVTSVKIADGTIATGDIGDGQVTRAKLATGVLPGVQLARADQTADLDSTSLAYVDVPGLTVTITTTAGSTVEAMWIGPLHHSTSGSAFVTLSADGVDGNVLAAGQTTSAAHDTAAFVVVTNPAAGAHTYKVRARCNGSGTLHIDSSQRASTLVVKEFKA